MPGYPVFVVAAFENHRYTRPLSKLTVSMVEISFLFMEQQRNEEMRRESEMLNDLFVPRNIDETCLIEDLLIAVATLFQE